MPKIEEEIYLSNKNAKPKDYVEIGVDAEEHYRIKNSKSDQDVSGLEIREIKRLQLYR
jgi:hypothetical protein